MDSTGQYLAAVELYGSIYYSSDYGASWRNCSVPYLDWQSIAADITGQFLCAVSSAYVYVSPDGGYTWNATKANPDDISFTAVASSSSGKMVVVTTGTSTG